MASINYNDTTTDKFIKAWNDERDYIIAQTSGSTGTPKEIRLKKSDMLASARSTCHFFDITENSVLICPLSADYIAGKMMIVRALLSHATLYMLPPSNAFDLSAFTTIDLLPIVPSQLENVLKQVGNANIRNIIIGGAPLSPLQEEMIFKSGINAFATYGMTETCSHVALRALTRENSTYEALPGYTFEIDERSCLIINSERQSFSRIVTNDVVTLINSTCFKWRGRFDNVIISGGLKAHPEHIEKVLTRYLSRPFYVIGRNDQKWGQKVTLIIEGTKMPINELIAKANTELKEHERIREVSFVTSLERTKSGKIIRK